MDKTRCYTIAVSLVYARLSADQVYKKKKTANKNTQRSRKTAPADLESSQGGGGVGVILRFGVRVSVHAVVKVNILGLGL